MPSSEHIHQYELIELTDQGEWLSVYRARDTEHNQMVVLTLLRSDDTQLVERFRQEAERLHTLHLPHTVPVRQVYAGSDAHYIVTDAPTGESLAQRLARSGSMEVDDTLAIVSQVAEALDYAHKQGLVHGRVHPGSIFLDGKAVMLASASLVETIGASYAYMAPECLDAQQAEQVDHRSDVYALACVVYEMLTGRPPFEGSEEEVLAAHQTQRPVPPRIHNPDLLPVLDAILLKALAKRPQSRYQTSGGLVAALREAVQEAQTRRMAGGGMFTGRIARDAKSTRPVLITDSAGGIPTWVWIGAGIFIAVVITLAILLATS